MSRLRWMTAGESHGPRLVAMVEGNPAGLPLLASATLLEELGSDSLRELVRNVDGYRAQIEAF